MNIHMFVSASFQGSSLSASPAPGSITAVARDQLQALGYSLHSTPPPSVVTAPSWSPQSPQASVSPVPRDTRSPASNSPQHNDIKDVSMIVSCCHSDKNYYRIVSCCHSDNSDKNSVFIFQNDYIPLNITHL